MYLNPYKFSTKYKTNTMLQKLFQLYLGNSELTFVFPVFPRFTGTNARTLVRYPNLSVEIKLVTDE